MVLGTKRPCRKGKSGAVVSLLASPKLCWGWGNKNLAYGRYLGRKAPLAIHWWPQFRYLRENKGSA